MVYKKVVYDTCDPECSSFWAAGDAPMGSSAQPHFFFGEDFTVFRNRIHVVTAAYGFLFLETLLLLLSLVVLPLTVTTFDVVTIVKALTNGGALLLALVAMLRKRHKLLWAFMCVKVIEIVVYLILFFTALVLCCTRPRALIHFMRWRIRTIDQSNQLLHIAGLLVVFLCYIVYCVAALDIVHRAFTYFRERAIFVYMEERRQAFQHIL